MARNGFSAGPLARFLRLMQECLPRHNMGEWFRREGTMLIAYFTLGSFAYSYFEAWSTLDSVYFMVVTSTTVGYGDISPESASGRLFTCAYSLVGITLVLAAIAPFIDWILRARQVVERFLTAVAACCVSVPREVEVHDLSADIKHTNQRINYPLRYLRAMLGPLMVLCVGVLLAFFIFGYSAIDSLYWAVISMTTVGYGDMHPDTTVAKLVAIIYLPLAVTALADALKEVNTIEVRRAIRETDYLAMVDTLLLEEARGDPDETLTEAEFMISVLKSHDLVDEPTLLAIRHQFFNLTRHDARRRERDDPLAPRVLDAQMVFAELVEHGRVRQRPRGGLAGETEYDPAKREEVPLVNLKSMDGGYREWRQYFWLNMVAQHSPTGRLVASAAEHDVWARGGESASDDESGEGGLAKPPPLRPPAPEYLAAKVARPRAGSVRHGGRRQRRGLGGGSAAVWAEGRSSSSSGSTEQWRAVAPPQGRAAPTTGCASSSGVPPSGSRAGDGRSGGGQWLL